MPPVFTGKYKNNETIIYNYLVDTMKFTRAIACAILSNIEKESSFNPTASVLDVNNKTSYGICQWNGGRFTNLKNFCKNNNLDYKTVTSQLKFFKYEIYTKGETTTGKLLDSYNKSSYNTLTYAKEIAGEFFDKFERGASVYRKDRVAGVDKYWDAYAGGSGGESNPVITEGSNKHSEGDDTYRYLSYHDPYSSTVQANLTRITSNSSKYGYLIDLTHGGQFQFYLPEFTEQAGANWSNVDITGRSVDVVSYNSTSSRSIGITLELYAGEGIYRVKDPVTKLHQDANFLKSLEYPDYSDPIATPPSVVQLILGEKLNMIGIVKDVTVEHRKPLDSQNRSMYLHVTFTVSQVAVNPPDYSDIRSGIYYLRTTT